MWRFKLIFYLPRFNSLLSLVKFSSLFFLSWSFMCLESNLNAFASTYLTFPIVDIDFRNDLSQWFLSKIVWWKIIFCKRKIYLKNFFFLHKFLSFSESIYSSSSDRNASLSYNFSYKITWNFLCFYNKGSEKKNYYLLLFPFLRQILIQQLWNKIFCIWWNVHKGENQKKTKIVILNY
jgi:hypothetical protein